MCTSSVKSEICSTERCASRMRGPASFGRRLNLTLPSFRKKLRR